jgi:anti-sigma B factor antagonist
MPQEPLKIDDSTRADNGCRVLCLKGPLLISNFFEFQSRVRANTCPKLILDLTEVPYIDSAAIGALVGAYVNHQKDGRVLALVGVTQRVGNSLKIAHVDSFFRFFDSLQAAESAGS